MTRELYLLTSLPYSGKTSQLRRLYRQRLSQQRYHAQSGRCLWLSPTQRSRAQVLEELMSEGLAIAIDPGVSTFDLFCESLLQSGAELVRALTDTQKRIILKQIISQSASRGGFSYFQPICGTRGFLSLVGSFISELKRDEIWPDDFKAATQSDSPKDRELLVIYKQYQAFLTERGFYDAEGRYWSARTQLAQQTHGQWSEFDLVIVDGFSDFTPTQYDILTTLAKRAAMMVVTLPWQHGSRADLFAKSRRAVDTLKARIAQLTDVQVHEPTLADFSIRHKIESPVPIGPSPAVAHLSKHLFDSPFQTTLSNDSDGIQILACYGQKSELQVVAERVKRLLAGRVRPDQIIVSARDLSEIGPLAAETFADAGIPIACDNALTLDRTLLCKQMMQLLLLIEEDWSFERLKSVLLSSWFDWSRLVPEFGLLSEQVPRQAMAYLRFRKLAGSRKVMLGLLARDRQKIEQIDREADPTLTMPRGFPLSQFDIILIERLLTQLSILLEPLHKRHSPLAWVELLAKTFQSLGWNPRSSRSGLAEVALGFSSQQRWPLSAAELWDYLLAQLFDLARFQERYAPSKTKWSLPEVIDFLKVSLEQLTLPPAVREQGRVRILPAAHVRNLDIDYLFVVGLNEMQFPLAHKENCLYSEAERTRFHAHGWQLVTRQAHEEDEMLLFYHLLTRPRKLLTLSYATTNHKGEPVFASPYLEQVRSLFTKDSLTVKNAGRLHPVPSLDEVVSPATQRIFAVDQALQKQPGYLQSLAQTKTQSAAVQNILSASRAATARFHTHGLTVYEGMLRDTANLTWLARRFSHEMAFSATQLESFAYCPFRFYAEHVLGISSHDDPRVETDRARRGNLVHDSLAQLHHVLIDNSPAEEVRDRFQEYLQAELGRDVSINDLHAALNRIEGQLLSEWAGFYSEQLNDYRTQSSTSWGVASQRTYTELSFGEISGFEDTSLPAQAQTFPPLHVGNSAQPVKVRGRIDRIDVGTTQTDQHTAQPVFTLIDYKTGNPKRFNEKELRSGKSLQLALYMLATIRLKLTGEDAIPWQIGFWEVHRDGFISGYKTKKRTQFFQLEAEIISLISQIIDELVPRLVEHMRAGHFAVYNQDKQCTSFCNFHMTCRINQVRQLEVPLQKRLSLGLPPAEGSNAMDQCLQSGETT